LDINDLLSLAVERKASDLHITVGVPPAIRIDGNLTRLTETPLKPEDTRRLVDQLLDEKMVVFFKEKGEVGFSHSSPGLGRFRVNAFHQRGTMSMAIRVINTNAPKITSLGLPDIVSKMTLRSKGLILVVGPAGSGKTTTLAAMVDLVNEERSCHIITLEDPIEYLHTHKKSIINQREIGSDSESFPISLRAALRQDPDVIMVGGMLDLETVSIALTAAETGNLVLASLHTMDAPQTINRMIEIFPQGQQSQVRVQLANCLIGIVAQRLLPRKDDQGRIAVVEFLAITSTIRNLIKEGRIQQIYSTMQTGAKSGMRTMDNHLQHLFGMGLIKAEDVMENALDRASMSRFMSRILTEEREIPMEDPFQQL
jgi:twitching motility protein PilT